jgi:DNA polymerase I
VRKSHLAVVPSERSNPFKKLINAYCTRGSRFQSDELTLVARDENGKLCIRKTKAEYSCFVRDSDMSEHVQRQLRESKFVEGIRKVGDHWRIVWKDRWMLAKAIRDDGWFKKRGIETFEADVDPVRRYLTDHDVEIANPRRCYTDIETDSRKGIAEAIIGNSRILSWAIVDAEGNLVASAVLEEDTDESERELLLKYWQHLQEFDQVCAWNGEKFDFPAIRNRSEKLRIRFDAIRLLFLDHLEAFERMNKSASKSGDEKQSMKLDFIAKSLGLKGKTEGVDGSKTWELWCSDKALLREYNENDTMLEQQIEQKTKYLEQLDALCALTYTFPDSRGMKPSRQVEGMLMKFGAKEGMRFPNRAVIEEGYKADPYDGAYRMEPECDGVEKDVHVCDFTGMYPRNILSFNLSIETVKNRLPDPNLGRPSYLPRVPEDAVDKIPEGCAVVPLTKVVVVQEPRGILPRVLEYCLALRAKYSEQKASFAPGTPESEEAERNDAAAKAFVNGFYGVMGLVYSRFYVRDLAESTTQIGVWLIKAVIQAARDRGLRVLYGDTDSAFVSGCTNEEFAEFVKWCNEVLFPKLTNERGAKWNCVKLAYEKKFSRLVMVSKSRYVGLFEHYKGKKATEDSKPEVKGLEYMRGDGSALGRQMQKEIFDLVLRDGCEDPLVFEAIVERYKTHVLHEQLDPKHFILSKRLTQKVDEYKSKTLPAHAQIAKDLIARGHTIRTGDKIEFIVVDGSDKLKVIPVIDYDPKDSTKNADRFYLWEQLVYPPSLRVLQSAFPKHNWAKYECVRPKRLRHVLSGQGGFGFGEAPAPNGFTAGDKS